MCDQVVSLISSEHAQTILWSEEDDENENDDNMLDIDQDESDRIIAFEAAQPNEQEGSVTVREGFKVNSFCALASFPADKTGILHYNFRLFRRRLYFLKHPVKI